MIFFINLMKGSKYSFSFFIIKYFINAKKNLGFDKD